MSTNNIMFFQIQTLYKRDQEESPDLFKSVSLYVE